MIEWSETDELIRGAVRQFIDAEIRPHLDDIEHNGVPPYDLLRKFYKTFGMDAMARDAFDQAMEKERALAAGDADNEKSKGGGFMGGAGAGQEAMGLMVVVELCRVSPGLVGSLGVSVGLAGGTIMSRGRIEQKERWARDILTLDKIGAWAITEPNAGSDAFGGMKTTVRRKGDGYVLNGQKTFITNGPYADTMVVYAKLDEDDDTDPRKRPVLTFVLEHGMPGLTQSRPFKKMGFNSSPTGELFFEDVYVEPDRLLGDPQVATNGDASRDAGRESARANFVGERYGMAAMSLGVIEECLALSLEYAKSRELWGKPIADFQLIQLKLAKMEVARLNVQNMVFRTIEMRRAGRLPSLGEASAMKWYSSQAAFDVAMEAVQLFGGNGYMAEYRVEQLARDAKSFMIYAGSNEIQITHVARELLGK